MLPDLSLLLALVLGLFSLGVPASDVDPLRALAGTGATVLVVAVLCRMAADRAIAAVADRDANALLRGVRVTSMWPFLGWIACLSLFGWGSFVGGTVPRAWFMVPYVLLYTPLAIMVASSWTAERRLQAAFSPEAPSTWGAIRRGLRRNAIILVPMAALTAAQEMLPALEALGVPGVRELRLLDDAFPDIEALLVLLFMALTGWFAPVIVARVLRTKPLPPGELRTQIERLCQVIGVRYRDLLVWNTSGRVMNALVVGLTGRTRYVIVTDALVDNLPVPEVLAVIAHEAGHAKLRHLPAYFAISLASLLLLRSAEELLLPWLPVGSQLVLMLVFLGFFWFGMLGWLSRRFERQADVFGAANAGALAPDAGTVELPGAPGPLPYGTATMVSALIHVVEHMGVGRAHRHGSPAERTEFLASFATDAGVRRQYEQDTRRLRRVLRGFIGLALLTTAARLPAGIERGGANLRLHEGTEASADADASRKRGEDAEARKGYERARALYVETAERAEKRPHDLRMLAIAATAVFNQADLDIHHLDRVDDARTGFERALKLADAASRGSNTSLAYQAHIDLGRIALRRARDGDPAAGVADAKQHLSAVRAMDLDVPSAEKRLLKRRSDLLEYAIDLRDPARAESARRNLELMSKTAEDLEPKESWEELARDAQEELRLAPK